MAKQRYYNQGEVSVPDPGLPAMQARVKAQRDAAATASAKREGPVTQEDALIASRHRVAEQRARAAEAIKEQQARTAKAAKATIKAAAPAASKAAKAAATPARATGKVRTKPAKAATPSTSSPSTGD